MKLRSLQASNYRSLKAIRMDCGDVNLFVGENGAGKSNLYRALSLVRAAATGSFAREIAFEGGMASVLWSGVRRRASRCASAFPSSFSTRRARLPGPTRSRRG